MQSLRFVAQGTHAILATALEGRDIFWVGWECVCGWEATGYFMFQFNYGNNY